MPWTPPQSLAGLSDRLALIVAGLREVLAAHMARDRSAVAVLFLAWTRLGRLASRFEALVRAVRAGRLPSGPSPRVQAAADFGLPRLEGLPQPFRLPGGFGWLIRLVPGAAVYGSQVQYLLADPEMAALLASAPQAGRILRPLCRMLGVRPGPGLLAPARTLPASTAPAEADGLRGAATRPGLPSDGAAAGAIAPDSRLESGPQPGSEPWSDAPWMARLPAGTPADPAADPPLNVPWGRPAPG
ncbi:MAG: hypothetical protein JOY71_22035 [Acetobacteraceae bacterium]|nr:hypothetical protein [Acetobacteraceae bacterium]